MEGIDKDMILLQEYEQMYINSGKNTIPSAYFNDLSPDQAQSQALFIIKFAIENYLKWTPMDVKNAMTRKVMEKLKLYNLLKKYVRFPQEYDISGNDLTYLAYLLYPNQFKVNIHEQCIEMFERVYNGEILKFPSTWISTGSGLLRFSIIMQYVISILPRFENKQALYEYFASSKGAKCLRKYKIYTYAMNLYDTPLDAMHFSMPDNIRSEFFYNYYRFKKSYSVPKFMKK